MAKKQYVQLGAMMQRKDPDANGEKQYYIKLDDKISLNINGKPFKGQYLNIEKPQAKQKRFLDMGLIDENTFEERLEKIPEFVKFELTAVFDD